MSTSRLLGVMAVLSTVIVTPVTAQPVDDRNPAIARFFYPNAKLPEQRARATPIPILERFPA